jgi:FkbM family methyltransferase
MRLRNKKIKEHFPTAEELYTRPGVWRINDEQRADMTISSRDADYIPKVKDAGKVSTLKDGTKVQIMHNGINVVSGGYYGDWMVRVIKELNGHHEPQEEKAFYEVLKRVKAGGTMVELGSHWAFYSIWFNKDIKNAKNYCIEPDPGYIEIGKQNAQLNNVSIDFKQAAAGDNDTKELEFPPETMPGQTIIVPILSVDKIVKTNKIKKIDILHMDVQGAELSALDGAKESIEKGKVRFVFVSTHHHSISFDPLMHQKCMKFLIDNGASIIASHSIHESFSGDGLIVASFDKQDKDFRVDISRNYSGNDLFIETEEDLAALAKEYSKLYDHYINDK